VSVLVEGKKATSTSREKPCARKPARTVLKQRVVR
jgi:hypothetical protein